MSVLSDVFYRELGRKLRDARVQAGLRQEAVSVMIGFKPRSGQSYVSRLEKGRVHGIELDTIVRYLQACKTPIGKFVLELAQSGAFGEAEQGLTVVVEDKAKADQARRAKAKLLYEKRWLREAKDADIIAKLWIEVQTAIAPLLPPGQPHFYSNYLNGVRAFYRAWKLAQREAKGVDPTSLVLAAFDRVERAGIELRLVPAAVRKMREIMFERLMAMTPQGGNT